MSNEKNSCCLELIGEDTETLLPSYMWITINPLEGSLFNNQFTVIESKRFFRGSYFEDGDIVCGQVLRGSMAKLLSDIIIVVLGDHSNQNHRSIDSFQTIV